MKEKFTNWSEKQLLLQFLRRSVHEFKKCAHFIIKLFLNNNGKNNIKLCQVIEHYWKIIKLGDSLGPSKGYKRHIKFLKAATFIAHNVENNFLSTEI